MVIRRYMACKQLQMNYSFLAFIALYRNMTKEGVLRAAITAQLSSFPLLKELVLYLHYFKACYTNRQTYFQSDLEQRKQNCSEVSFPLLFSSSGAARYQDAAINWANCHLPLKKTFTTSLVNRNCTRITICTAASSGNAQYVTML